jgi:site-specific recombinase XerD
MAGCWAAHVRLTAMKAGYFVALVSGIVAPPPGTRFAEDAALVRGGFADYLRRLGLSPLTVDLYLRRLMLIAHWLHEHPHRLPLSKLTRRAIPNLLNDCLEGRGFETFINYRKALNHWLRFQARFAKQANGAPWQSWVEDYANFLRTHRGVGSTTIEHSVANAQAFLRWQFGRAKADWSRVHKSDIWAFAQHHSTGVKPIFAKARLGYLRRFLRFVELRGACSKELPGAVPKIAVHEHSTPPQILSDRQQQQLRSSFNRTRPEGKRNYAMTLCMLDLGLRGSEVISLGLSDIDWEGHWLNVRASKTGRGRQLPIPTRVFVALRDYVENARPAGGSFDNVFVRHPRRVGHPLSRSALKAMISAAYRRCQFPTSWSGTHRLRHTFASRLHKRGAEMKPIADLLGHRRLNSTNDYTHVDAEAMRRLAQPWPV